MSTPVNQHSNIHKVSFEYGNQNVTLETGFLAQQAAAAVTVTIGETVILATVATKACSTSGRNFLPLTVNFIEKFYAAGKVPGGYFKRENRPSEQETLISRLIDRAIRPCFPKNFYDDIQVILTVLSMEPGQLPDIPAFIGASAALCLSGLPFQGPIGAIRVGYTDNNFTINPATSDLETSSLNLVIAGNEQDPLMVESKAQELSQETMSKAILYGQEQLQTVNKHINLLTEKVANPASSYVPTEASKLELKINDLLTENYANKIAETLKTTEKTARNEELESLLAQIIEENSPALTQEYETDAETTTAAIKDAYKQLKQQTMRKTVLNGGARLDGRDSKTVRPISTQIGLLPRAHGSAVFTRGQTQALVTTTLASEKDAQLIDSIHGESRDSFMLHYNFPPYSTGEVGMLLSPKRREIGHGRLARRAMEAVLPDPAEFPYTIRIVSEILSSNGSSSMASVCGASLALMDAGVPIKTPVAGIAMGLISEGNDYVILTDILGDEDAFGDMDFKVAGTKNGITALQMDIKITGVSKSILDEALTQAVEGKKHILNCMNTCIEQARETISELAPRFEQIKIDKDKIRDVIGKGGVTIREITEKFGVTIDISDDGLVKICAANQEDGLKAKEYIHTLTADVTIGTTYTGKIVKIMDFGAFVNLLPGKDGFLHISQIANERINDINDRLHEGQEITVKVVEIDKLNRVKLTMKDLVHNDS